MKTAISVPDSVFEKVERHAHQLGLSRSEFFATAAERWANELEGAELTEAIDDAIEAAGSDDTAAFSQRAAQQLFTREAEQHNGPQR